MTRLLALSFDAPSSPRITLRWRAGDPAASQQHSGWGIAWYPPDELGAVVVKDPTSRGDDAMTAMLREWSRFRSSVFVGHLRGAARRVGQEDTHPFDRRYASRGWVLTHNGQLTEGYREKLQGKVAPFHEPVGHTDSERILCWLLDRMRRQRIRRLADVGWDRLHRWLGEVNALGTTNLIISDGGDIVVYQDLGGFNPLHWTRRRPPHAHTVLAGDDFEVDFSDSRDSVRTAILVATRPLSPLVAESGGAQGDPLMTGSMGLVTSDPSSIGSVSLDRVSHQTPSLGASALDAATPGSDLSHSAALAFTAGDGSSFAEQAPPSPVGGDMDEGTYWSQLAGGQMLVLRRGTVMWDSHGTATDAVPRSGVAPPSAVHYAPRPGTQGMQQSASSGPLPLSDPPDSGTRWTQGTRGAAASDPVYRVHHETLYRYEEPIERSSHMLRVRPIDDRHQELLEHDLSIEPGVGAHYYEDVFGNDVAAFDIERPYDVLRVVSTSLVRVLKDQRRALHAPVRRSSIPLVWMPWQRQMMSPYLLPHELPETQLRELFDYAMGFVERQDYDLTETLLDINRTIFTDFAYKQGSTTVETTPFEVYSTRKGVCQDFANLLICMARLLNVPARYRVGYIHTNKDYANTVQSDASHAWAEVYLPWFGWQGLDPTNGCLAAQDHVRVACGRNYRDATPTTGTIFRGGGTETLSIDVRVELR